MIKIEIMRTQLCSGNVRSYSRKPKLFTKEFETQKDVSEWIEWVKNNRNNKWFIYDLSTLKVGV